ncbi:MAG: hypothetical protein O3C27_06625, partial [Actinomycetota bacterium]|nr:hypothetical protein [Actinomycetota bacterium]
MTSSAAFLLLLAGCGEDDTSDATTDATESAAPDDSARPVVSGDLSPEEEAYCAELAALPEGKDPGFDAFFAENPEPSLEDWAE